MEKTIKELIINKETGEKYEVGKNGVLKIEEYSARGEGDEWFYDVITEKHTYRLFKFEMVIFDNN